MINEVGKIYSRPWGTYKTIELADNYQIKIITVNPSGRLSLQKHARRSEHWLVVAGEPMITVGKIVKKYQIGDHVFIPVGIEHRAENFTDAIIVIAEIQIGSYLGEDDIVRIEDVYNRN